MENTDNTTIPLLEVLPDEGERVSVPDGTSSRKLSSDLIKVFKRNKAISVAAVIGSFLFSAAVLFLCLKEIKTLSNGIYLLDEGSAFHASLSSGRGLSMDLEIEDHLGRFHEHLFNLAPSKRAIEESLEAAYRLSDRSVYEYTMDLAEKGYYSRMISANISQQIVVDSVVVEKGKRPYPAKTYSRLFILRESSVSEYRLVSSCEIVPIQRSADNPHGLLIEKFRVTEESLVSSVKR